MNQIMMGVYIIIVVFLYMVYSELPANRSQQNRTAVELAEIK